jgi:hypothetical protein
MNGSLPPPRAVAKSRHHAQWPINAATRSGIGLPMAVLFGRIPVRTEQDESAQCGSGMREVVMAYSDFTIAEIKRKFQLIIDEDVDLFSATPETASSEWLAETLHETLSLVLAVNTEKVRSELIIAPVLVEFRKQTGRTISLFSGVDFTIDPSRGLNGICDYIVSNSSEQLFVSSPVLIIFEAKNENIKGGFAQCIAAMIAAQHFNLREGNAIPLIHGVVTTGTNWRFLQLEDHIVRIDQREYYIDNVPKILGILLTMITINGPTSQVAK